MTMQEEKERKKKKAKIKLFQRGKVFLKNGRSAKDFESFAKVSMKNEIAIIGNSSFAKMIDLFEEV